VNYLKPRKACAQSKSISTRKSASYE